MCLLHRAISCLSYLRRYLRLLCVEPLGSSANSCHQYDVGRRERCELREAIEEPLVLLFALISAQLWNNADAPKEMYAEGSPGFLIHTRIKDWWYYSALGPCHSGGGALGMAVRCFKEKMVRT